MKEYIEMANPPPSSSSKGMDPLPSSTSSSSFTKNPTPSSSSTSMKTPILVEKLLKRDFELRPVSHRSISYGWVILPVLCYLGVLVGGIMTCIGVGNTSAFFDYYCIFNANFTLRIKTSSPGGGRMLEGFDMSSWGNKNDCLFTEYGSVGLALFSGVWIVMVLQCGRGGASRRGFRLPDAWRIVAPTCVGNTVLFVVACFILSSVSTGWETFCQNSLLKIDDQVVKIEDSNMTCADILSFTYKPKEVKLMAYIEHIDLLKQSRIAQIGATIQFFGCLIGFLIVILRCCNGPDFDLYVRRDVAYVPANTEEEQEPDVEKGGGGQLFRRTQEDDDDDDDEDYFDANVSPGSQAQQKQENPNANIATVICHSVPISSTTQGTNTEEAEEDENSSLKSTTGLILN